MIEKKRNLTLDLAKAIAIILVVVGHSIQYGSGAQYLSQQCYFENGLFRFIYSFHMPLFMLISGYAFGYSRRDWREELGRRIGSLLVPILVWSVVPFISGLIRAESITAVSLIKLLVSSVVHNLWFLWAVLLCSVFVLLCRRFLGDSLIVYAAAFVLTFVLPDNVNLSLYKFMYPYFVTGYLFHVRVSKEKVHRLCRTRWLLPVLVAAYVLLLLGYGNDSFIYTSGHCILHDPLRMLGIDIYRYAIGFVGSAAVLLVCAKLSGHLHGRLGAAVALLGRRTMGIYILSGCIFSYILPAITRGSDSVNALILIAEAAAILAVSLLLTEAISRCRVLNRLLLGGR